MKNFIIFVLSISKNSSVRENMKNRAKFVFGKGMEMISYATSQQKAFFFGKFLYIENEKIISVFFMCENSRDEKSLNDDWRKLQKTEREREKRLFFVLWGSCECKKGGENCYTHIHTHAERRFHHQDLSCASDY